MLPEELLEQLRNDFPCRELQIRQLSALYSPQFPSPPLLVVHGLEATGKTSIVKGVLSANQIQHCIVNSHECITGRHLLERTVKACLDALDEHDDVKINRKPYARCENISALVVHLQRMLEGREKFVLVLDGIDKQREAPPTLLPALARFGELVPSLSILLITSLANPTSFHRPGIPYVHFPTYTRSESITILSQHPPKIFAIPPSETQYLDYTADLAAEDDLWVWTRFLATVWDTLSKQASRDLVSFRATSLKLWREFVRPIVEGQFGTRDFSRLMVNRRTLFQGEDTLLDRIVSVRKPLDEPSDAVNTGTPQKRNAAATVVKKKPLPLDHDLPYYTKYLLIAAYLASYNPARTDSTYFMHHHDGRRNRRKVKHNVTSSWTKAKHRRIPRHLLTPSPFPLDRLFAIFRALVEGEDQVPQTADLFTQVATLTSLRLLVRAGAGVAGGDVLEPGAKWRVNFGWEWVRGLGRAVGIEVGEWLVGGVDG